MFRKILIANRGEIAVRIIQTLNKMGIQSVAIYSKVDEKSPHVMLADEAYEVGENEASKSYLNIKRIIEIAKKSGVDAIHPGYGFLSENPEFALAVRKEKIAFIGPSDKALKTMGSKKIAKQLLEPLNIPLIPGYHGENQSPTHLLKEAHRIGFPVLIKPADGGGGKGMMKVEKESDFLSALERAKRISSSAFGSDDIILEKYLKHPRHVEIQIMADCHHEVVHLFERDCSIQRRHQKIIEEAPIFGISENILKALYKTAIDIAKTIEYEGAGTLEFLVEDESFYFMEMNTRLQVEHPVTEMITGVDLVEWQIRIANQEPFPYSPSPLKKQGHAIECRICAENPKRDFMPETGTITRLKIPQGDMIRVDNGVLAGSVISPYYDSMIGKLIAWGNHREEALERLKKAIESYEIEGLHTNLSFLAAILTNSRFEKGDVNTHFLLEEHIAEKIPDRHEIRIFLAAYEHLKAFHHLKDPLYQSTFSYEPFHAREAYFYYLIDEKKEVVKVSSSDNKEIILHEENQSYRLKIFQEEKNKLIVFDDTQKYEATIFEHDGEISLHTKKGMVNVSRFSHNIQKDNLFSELKAPMPGTVTALLKEPGENVQKGDALMVLEAMKMEHTISAPEDGILKTFLFKMGEQVKEGDELLILE